MKMFAVLALGVGLACLPGSTQARKADPPKLEGKYTVVVKKKNGVAVGDAKKMGFEFKNKTFHFESRGDGKIPYDDGFVLTYKIDPKTTPLNIDMECVALYVKEKIDFDIGTRAEGIIEVDGDTVKLAYSLEKGKRPKNFEGKDGFYFELKKKGK